MREMIKLPAVDRSKKKTKSVKVMNKPLKDILYYLTDDNFLEGVISRVGDRRFSARFILLKKTTSK